MKEWLIENWELIPVYVTLAWTVIQYQRGDL